MREPPTCDRKYTPLLTARALKWSWTQGSRECFSPLALNTFIHIERGAQRNGMFFVVIELVLLSIPSIAVLLIRSRKLKWVSSDNQ